MNRSGIQRSFWLRQPLVGFLCITFVLAAALGWLSWRLIEQDSQLVQQRVRDRLTTTADVVTGVMTTRLSSLRDALSTLAASPVPGSASMPVAPDTGVLIAVLSGQGVDVYPADALRFYPEIRRSDAPPGGIFDAGEVLEFRNQDYEGAAQVFRTLAAAEEQVVRGGALLRLARNLRKAGESDEALRAYERLGQLGDTLVEGRPAELWARYERLVVLEQLGQTRAHDESAEALFRDLQSGRWQLTGPVFRFYFEATRRWLSSDALAEAAVGHATLAVASGVEALWQQWRHGVRSGRAESGWRNFDTSHGQAFVMWQTGADRLVVLASPLAQVESQLFPQIEAVAKNFNVVVRLTPRDRALASGDDNPGPAIVRTGVETGLPWNVEVRDGNPESVEADLTSRGGLFIGVMSLIATFVIVVGYFGVRSVSRELRAAALQSDFVSAVSHEFRSPLASLRQLGELLEDGRVPSEERRREYYAQLTAETSRLQRLVEGLLDFGRTEAGGREYRFERIDSAALVCGVGAEFSKECAGRGYAVVIDCDVDSVYVKGDAEALSLAIRNLLDNAVKYSATRKTVWLTARQRSSSFEIAVRDEGVGIAACELKQIFGKFVRGSSTVTCTPLRARPRAVVRPPMPAPTTIALRTVIRHEQRPRLPAAARNGREPGRPAPRTSGSSRTGSPAGSSGPRRPRAARRRAPWATGRRG